MEDIFTETTSNKELMPKIYSFHKAQKQQKLGEEMSRHIYKDRWSTDIWRMFISSIMQFNTKIRHHTTLRKIVYVGKKETRSLDKDVKIKGM